MRFYRIETAPLYPLVMTETDNRALALQLAPVMAQHCDWPVRVIAQARNKIVATFERDGTQSFVEAEPRPVAAVIDPLISRANALERAEKSTGLCYIIRDASTGRYYTGNTRFPTRAADTVVMRFVDGELDTCYE